jgi:hypothetical protein
VGYFEVATGGAFWVAIRDGKVSVFLYNPKLQPIDWISIDI